MDCGSPAAAFPSQPCWRPVQGICLQPNGSANAAAVQRWPAPSPCPGSRAASRKRQEACRSPRSLRLGRRCEKHLGVRQPCCRFSQPALLATRSRDMPPTKQLRQRGSGLALARAKPVSRQQGCLQKAAGGLPQSKEPAAREAVRSTLDCGSPAAAFPSQPCWRPVRGMCLQPNGSANAAAVQRWPAPSPCPGSRAASRKRQEACRSPRSLRLMLGRHGLAGQSGRDLGP